MRSTWRQDILNKRLKRNLHQLKEFCAENGLEAFRAKIVEICLMAIYLQPNCIKIAGSILLTSDEIHIITNYFHLDLLNMGYKNI